MSKRPPAWGVGGHWFDPMEGVQTTVSGGVDDVYIAYTAMPSRISQLQSTLRLSDLWKPRKACKNGNKPRKG